MRKFYKALFALLLVGLTPSCEQGEPAYVENFIVGYDANGGVGEMSHETFPSNETKALNTNEFVKNEYTFAGWAIDPDSVAIYKNGEQYLATENIILYATWSEMAVSPDMVLIEGGTYDFGNISNDDPFVTVSDFYIGKYEVTQAEWNEVISLNKSYFKGDNLPVERVSWYETIEYCNARSAKEGLSPYYTIDTSTDDPNNLDTADPMRWTITINEESKGYRLPTEAEWEWAARGGNQSQKYAYAGSNNLDEVGWYKDNADGRTHIVGALAPNELGLYDMTGNMAEWCWDWYSTLDAIGRTPTTDSQGPEQGKGRVCRSGCWYMQKAFNGIMARGSYYNYDRSWDVGFRIARSVGEDVMPDLTPIEMVEVKGGTFTMSHSDIYNNTLVSSTQTVTLSDFRMAKYETTQAQWQEVMGSNPSYSKSSNKPVELVTWYAAIEYCNARSEREGLTPCYTIDKDTTDPNNNNTGKDTIKWLVTLDMTANGYRLPTEAEWEWAAIGGAKSSGYTYSGGNILGDVAWYGENTSSSQPVGGKTANELGLYDMSGNIHEWCWDWFGARYVCNGVTNPTGAESGTLRVIRGGSWYYSEDYGCEPTYRGYIYGAATLTYLGFRVVRNAE